MSFTTLHLFIFLLYLDLNRLKANEQLIFKNAKKVGIFGIKKTFIIKHLEI